MKKTILFVVFSVLYYSVLLAQNYKLIDNKGNRNLSYPIVNEESTKVREIIDQVSIENLETDIRWMQDIGCRDARTEEAMEVQNGLVEKLEALGLDVEIQKFYCPRTHYTGRCTPDDRSKDTLDAGNVIAIQYGTEFPDEYIVISSHYDHPDGPGADDNASGTAGMLECAKILSNYSFKRSIIYISFNAEEYGMYGSWDFVKRCAEKNMNILACLNLDMIGYFPESIEDLAMYSGASPISENLFSFYRNIANLYIPEIPTHRFSFKDSYGGDHLPFNIYEYPALYIGDVEHIDLHPCYHQLCDTIGNGFNNFLLAKSFVQATLATAATLADEWLGPQDLAVLPSDSKIIISWNNATETSSYKIYKNAQFLTEVFDTVYEDTNVTNGTEYSYYVTAINESTNRESAPSNTDKIILSTSLSLPFFDDFESESDLWYSYPTPWIYKELMYNSNDKSITNTYYEFSSDNYISIIELNWFSIPDFAEEASLSFDIYKNISLVNFENNNSYLEITQDRRHWHKIANFAGVGRTWDNIIIPLNEYVGSPFVQLRFRIESTGQLDYYSPKQLYIDNVKIEYSPVSDTYIAKNTNDKHNIIVYPNPSNGIFNLQTDIYKPYSVTVYDLVGVQHFHNDNFNNGELDLSGLKKGSYILKIKTDKDNFARKIIIK